MNCWKAILDHGHPDQQKSPGNPGLFCLGAFDGFD